MTPTSLVRTAVRVYPRTPWSDRRALNTHRRRWIAAVIQLGDRWILAHPVQRKTHDYLD